MTTEAVYLLIALDGSTAVADADSLFRFID